MGASGRDPERRSVAKGKAWNVLQQQLTVTLAPWAAAAAAANCLLASCPFAPLDRLGRLPQRPGEQGVDREAGEQP
ncbi:MAG: hypothetical protein WAM11_16240 [Cyanobium sp.]